MALSASLSPSVAGLGCLSWVQCDSPLPKLNRSCSLLPRGPSPRLNLPISQRWRPSIAPACPGVPSLHSASCLAPYESRASLCPVTLRCAVLFSVLAEFLGPHTGHTNRAAVLFALQNSRESLLFLSLKKLQKQCVSPCSWGWGRR